MALRQLVIDQYTALAHKAPIATTNDDRADTLAPTWIPADQRRRLDAYKILAAYQANAARELVTTATQTEKDARREYGDAHLLVTRVAGAVIGDELTITVDGAEPVPDLPELPDRPEDLADDATPLEQRIHARRTARWEADVERHVQAWEQALDSQPALADRQDWLRDWADRQQLPAKIVEGEHDTVGLGDGVYALTLDASGTPLVEVYDPGFYFPVLTDTTTGYPTKVHLAWEHETRHGGKVQKWIRRLTWELVDLNVATFDFELGDFPRTDTGDIALPVGASIDADGRIVRRYPWHAPDDDPSPTTCVFTDATWAWEDVGGRNIHDLTDDRAVFAFTDTGLQARRLDLGIDFIPVVHVPNTPASRTHFGRSVLDVVAQVLDDLSSSDTDLQAASALAAGPAVALSSSSNAGKLNVRPGAVFNLGEGGRMDVLDLSAGLAELRAVNGGLQERLSVNSQVPAEVLGRVEENRPVAGVGIALRFAPFRGLIDMLRLTRAPKGQLLLKFVQRMAQAGGTLEPGPTPVARLNPGPFLPSDLAGIVEMVVALLSAKGISRTTALRLLVAAGVDISDAAAELDAINADDTAAALAVAEATGSEQLAADRLGVELPDAAGVAPTVTLPDPGGGE